MSLFNSNKYQFQFQILIQQSDVTRFEAYHTCTEIMANWPNIVLVR